MLEGTVKSGAVVTALGALAISGTELSFRESDKVLVLVRPEQLELRTGNGGAGNGGTGNGSGGLSGRVVECRYFGHDMLVTVQVAEELANGRHLLHVRLTGKSPLGTGSPVALSVDGPVKAWPASP